MIKKFAIASILLALALIAVPENYHAGGARCTGSRSCKACKTCEYCKHCAKEGGTCGVCKK